MSDVLFPVERQQQILELIAECDRVTTAELASQFGVNQVTVRRDLRTLAERGEVLLTHGGASRPLPSSPLVREVDLPAKQTTNLEGKRQIARKAAALIEPGQVVALNSGSTVQFLVDELPADLAPTTFVTLGINVAHSVARLSSATLLVAGGTYRPVSDALTGDFAVRFLADLRADIAFLGATAVDLDAGWTHPAVEEVATNRAMLAMAPRRYLVADSSKFGMVGLAKIADLSNFTGIVVDDDVPVDVVSWADDHGIEVI